MVVGGVVTSAWVLRPGTGPLRAARATAVAASSVGLGALGHLAADGCLSVTGAVWAFALIGAASWSLLSRQRSTGFFLLWLAGSQSVAHGAFTFFCRHTGPEPVPSHPVLSMLTAHVLALALVALLLGRAEARTWAPATLVRVLRAAARAVRAVVARLTPVALPYRYPVVRRTSTGPHRRPARSLWASPAPARRGPPRVRAA
jgi:hypothetical protein